MDARIVEFAEVLRQNGVRVATSEVNDAVRAAFEVGFADRPRFKAVLRKRFDQADMYIVSWPIERI